MDMNKIRNPEDISGGVEKRVIPLEDGDTLKDVFDFVYVLHNVPGPDTDRDQFAEQYAGCECEGKCDDSCPCIQRYGRPYSDCCRYIHDPFSNQMKPVIECNKVCKCNVDCTNRVVQLGIQCSLQVFRTKAKGFGVRTLEEIPRNSFVCEYAGEILTYEDAKARAHSLKSSDCNYILVVNEYVGSGNICTTYVDPTFIGNVGRFLNHSCKPNLYMIPVRVNNNIPRFALFALRDIEAQEELCYDYSGVIKVANVHIPDEIMPSVMNHKSKSPKRFLKITPPPAEQKAPKFTPRTVCCCGATQCKGFLPFDASLFKEDE